MGPDQLGVALIIPNWTDGFEVRSSDLMHQCASGLIRALEKLAIFAKFQGKNDLVCDNRKIAGLGLFQPNSSKGLGRGNLPQTLGYTGFTCRDQVGVALPY